MNTAYEELWQFAACFFGQDFDLDYSTADEAVLDFAPEQGSEAVESLLAEIDRLLSTSLTDDELRDLWVTQLHANYDPRDDGLTYREWFAHVRDLLTQAKAD